MAEVGNIGARALRSLIPPPRLHLSEWIEKEMRLPAATTALPGPVRLYPYQRGIADAISDPAIERVTVVKSVRVGLTMLLTGGIGSFVANEPAPILVLQPTDSDARDFVVSDLEPTFDATPALRGALTQGADDGEDRNTLTSRRFPGGSLKVVAAKSPRNLRRHTARVLFCDEIDAMEVSKEGNPLRLAENRTLSFGNRKIVMGSTPVFEDTSHVLHAYAASDQRVFEVPCPNCGAFHEIMWGDIRWEKNKPDTAAFRCPHCEQRISEKCKAAMVAAGEWRATMPEVKGHAGFRLNSLISPLANAAWPKLVEEWLRAQHDVALMKSFHNTILGLGWKTEGEELDENAIAGRAQPFDLENIPEGVLLLTCGCDVQDDRLEASIVGFDKNDVPHVLAHHVIIGSPDDNGTWSELEDLLRSQWQHPLGGKLGIDACGVDSGDGDWTQKVYEFCWPRTRRKVFAVKGMSGPRATIYLNAASKAKGPVQIVGVDTIKTTIFQRLQRGADNIKFSHTLQPVYYDQLTSERRVVRKKNGGLVHAFELLPGKRRAEALDALVYAMAVRDTVRLSLTDREDYLRSPQLVKPRPTIFKSAFMQR